MEGTLNKIINSKSRTFLAFCFCFILGAASFSWVLERDNLLFYLFIVLFFPFLLLILFWHRPTHRFLSFYLLFFLLGAMRFVSAVPPPASDHLRYYNGREVRVIGYVSDEPDIRIGEARYIVRVEQISVDGMPGRKVKGKLLLKTPLYPQYEYGERMTLSCQLEAPEKDEKTRFDYPRYLARNGVWSVCKNRISLMALWPANITNVTNKISVVSGRSSTISDIQDFGGRQRIFLMMKSILRLKSRLANQINRLWSEPESSFMAGLLYGARSGLPEDLKDNFNRTGVTHIIAVSGFNVSIIAVALMSALIYIGLYRRQAFWAAIGGIALFALFTGASASVVRAGLMASTVLFAQYLGRLSSAGRLMVFAAVAMLLINPWVLVWDAGFQLSFLATLGLVYLAPIISRNASSTLGVSIGASIGETITSTLAAIMATFPLILYQFGRFSVVAPLANLLILWIIPWLMLFGFMAIMASFVFFPLGQVVAWVAQAGLRYVITVVEWFGDKTWSSVELQIPAWFMILMYGAIVMFVMAKGNSGMVKRFIGQHSPPARYRQ